jgi:hypothetical protein
MAFPFGCDVSGDATRPPLDTLELRDFVGTFVLTDVNGKSLPAISWVHPSGRFLDTIFSGVLTLRSDGRYVREWDLRPCNSYFTPNVLTCTSRLVTHDSSAWFVERDSVLLGNQVRGAGLDVLNFHSYNATALPGAR